MYRSQTYIPPLVRRAMTLADQMGYPESCSIESGRLLQLLASHMQSGVIGEIGTGCGVAAAWIASTLSPGTSFFTVEGDAVRAAAVRALFEPLLNVRVIHGDWRDFLSHWRFGLLYAGRNSPRELGFQELFASLRSGGTIVLDGLIPLSCLPLEMRDQPDPLREFWLNEPRLAATEILVSSNESIILATLVD